MLFWNVLSYISTGYHTCYHSRYNMFMGILHHFQRSSIITSLPDVLLCALSYIFSETSIYSQTCLNDHLYKTTTRLRLPMLSPPIPILIQSLLYKTTTCLTRPATTFFVPQMKKTLPKTATAKLYPAEKWEAMHKK